MNKGNIVKSGTGVFVLSPFFGSARDSNPILRKSDIRSKTVFTLVEDCACLLV